MEDEHFLQPFHGRIGLGDNCLMGEVGLFLEIEHLLSQSGDLCEICVGNSIANVPRGLWFELAEVAF